MIRKYVTGFSMIEMLISMVVASIVIIGVYSFLSSSQRSFNLVQANDGMNRNMLIANRNVVDFIHMAGFRNYRRVVDRITFPKAKYTFDNYDGGDVTFAYNSFVTASNLESGTSTHKRNHLFIRYYGSSIDDDMNYDVEEIQSNGRMFDCSGTFLSREELAIVHLFVDNSGLHCQHIVNNEVKGTSRTDTVLINPNVTDMMFAFRSDGQVEFNLVGDMDSSSANELENYSLVNAIRYGFITRQETHQRVMQIASSGGGLVYHILGMDNSSESSNMESDKIEIPRTDDSRHDIYNLVSGVVYARNRFYEVK